MFSSTNETTGSLQLCPSPSSYSASLISPVFLPNYIFLFSTSYREEEADHGGLSLQFFLCSYPLLPVRHIIITFRPFAAEIKCRMADWLVVVCLCLSYLCAFCTHCDHLLLDSRSTPLTPPAAVTTVLRTQLNRA